MEYSLEQLIVYASTALFCALVVLFYVRKGKKKSKIIEEKIELAKKEGRHEPVSLHPYINLDACMGSGACVKACPEKDILGIVNGKATLINSSNCVGHGACFQACPTEAISLRIGTEQRGIDLPHVKENYESNVNGIYIAGELGGMGLIKNSVEQGKQAIISISKSNKKSNPNVLDVVIIGAGPAGIGASLMAKKLNLSFKTLEQDSLGGTVFTFPRSKLVMTSPMELPLYGKVKLQDTSKQELLALWTEVLGNNNIEIEQNVKVEKITPLKDETFKVVTANGNEILTNHVVVAIGRRGTPRKLNVPGEESTKVAYRLLEPEDITGKSILVVGGGDSAVESALLLKDQNKVSISYRKETFARIKPKNQEKIAASISKGEIEGLLNTEVEKILENSVILKNNITQEKINVANDLVYIFIGGELPSDFLKNAGIDVSKKFGHIVKKY